MWPFGKSAQARLEDALADQDLTKDLGLKVDVKKMVAIVTGAVPNERYPNLITAIANGINGIESVDVSGLIVQSLTAAPGAATPSIAMGGVPGAATGALKGAAAAVTDSSAMAKAVLSKFRDDAILKDDPIDVLQKGDTVVVRGAVDSQAEFDRAKALAASVPGVTGVDVGGLQVIEHASQLNVTDDDGDVVYTVKSGDTLSHIALHYYGSAGRSSYLKIAEANGIADPNKIRVGQKLKIPGTTKGPEAVLG